VRLSLGIVSNVAANRQGINMTTDQIIGWLAVTIKDFSNNEDLTSKEAAQSLEELKEKIESERKFGIVIDDSMSNNYKVFYESGNQACAELFYKSHKLRKEPIELIEYNVIKKTGKK